MSVTSGRGKSGKNGYQSVTVFSVSSDAHVTDSRGLGAPGPAATRSLKEMRTWLDFLFQCKDALNRIGEANSGVIKIAGLLFTLRMLALRETEALKEQQRESKTSATIQRIKQFLTTLVSRIVVALESTATRTSQPKEESLTAVEDLPSIRKTRLLLPLPQFLPPAATPGGLPLSRFLPPAATPGGV